MDFVAVVGFAIVVGRVRMGCLVVVRCVGSVQMCSSKGGKKEGPPPDILLFGPLGTP